MAITTEMLSYNDDSMPCLGWLALPEGDGPHPGVVVCPAWGGLGEFEKGRAEALAELGYAALALDVYGNGTTGSSKEENGELMTPFVEDRALLQGRLAAGLDALARLDRVDATRIAAIGYCFGGLAALDIARMGAPVRGVASLHGLFFPADNLTGRTIDTRVLTLHGWDDPMVPPDAVRAFADEMTAAGADWQLHAYGHTMHAFSNPSANDPDFGTVYNPVAERRSWRAVQNFLEEVLA